MNRIWKAILIIAILTVLFVLSRVDLNGQVPMPHTYNLADVMAREQHEKKAPWLLPYRIRLGLDNYLRPMAPDRLDVLEARVDSLEVKLERTEKALSLFYSIKELALDVDEKQQQAIDSLEVMLERAHIVITVDSTWHGGTSWIEKFIYEVSFEAVDSTQEQ